MNTRRALVVATAVALTLAFGGTEAAAAADTTPPTTPTNFRVASFTSTTVTLAWSPSTDNSGHFHYFIRDNFHQVAYPQKTATSWTFSAPWPNTTYTYTIQAADFATPKNWSGTATTSHTSAPDTTPPTAPVLSVYYIASARIGVSWTRGVDDSSWFVTHMLLVNGAPRTGDIGGGLGQTLLFLTPSTTYTMVVRASDPSGNTSFSNTVTVTTPAQTDFTPPTAPTTFTVEALDGAGNVSGVSNPLVLNVDHC